MRPLHRNEACLVRLLLEADFEGVEALREQMPATTVTGSWSANSPSLHLSVGQAAIRSAVADGPTPVEAWVHGPAGELLGTLLLWVSDGYLSALEYGWVTEEPPTSLPAAGTVHVRR